MSVSTRSASTESAAVTLEVHTSPNGGHRSMCVFSGMRWIQGSRSHVTKLKESWVVSTLQYYRHGANSEWSCSREGRCTRTLVHLVEFTEADSRDSCHSKQKQNSHKSKKINHSTMVHVFITFRSTPYQDTCVANLFSLNTNPRLCQKKMKPPPSIQSFAVDYPQQEITNGIDCRKRLQPVRGGPLVTMS